MKKNEFVFNFNGPVGEYIEKVDHMTVNFHKDGRMEVIKEDKHETK